MQVDAADLYHVVDDMPKGSQKQWSAIKTQVRAANSATASDISGTFEKAFNKKDRRGKDARVVAGVVEPVVGIILRFNVKRFETWLSDLLSIKAKILDSFGDIPSKPAKALELAPLPVRESGSRFQEKKGTSIQLAPWKDGSLTLTRVPSPRVHRRRGPT